MQSDIALNMICQGKRYRPVEETKAQEIAKSMQQQGLLQPIGVRPCLCEAHDVLRHFRLLFGAHRLRAAEMLEWERIAATVFPNDMSEEMAQLAELQENSARNDLTGAQRKQYAGEIGQLLSIFKNASESLIETESWMIEYIQKANIPRPTFYLWWNAFCAETGCPRTPKQATEEDQQAFFDWLKEQQVREEAEKQRKEKEAILKRQRKDCADEVEALFDLIQTYGFPVVYQEVWQVVCTQVGIGTAEEMATLMAQAK